MDFETVILFSLRDLNFDNVDHLLTEREIKLRYRDLALKFHPDKHIFDDDTMMIKINNAKDFLIKNLDQVNQLLCRKNPQILMQEAIRKEEARAEAERAEKERKAQEEAKRKAQEEEIRKKREKEAAERQRKAEEERRQRLEREKAERERKIREEQKRIALERQRKLAEERKFKKWYDSLSPKEKKAYDKKQLKIAKKEKRKAFLASHPHYYRNVICSILVVGIIILVCGICIWRFMIYPVGYYNRGLKYYEDKKYELSMTEFEKAGSYKDSKAYLKRASGELLVLQGKPHEAGVLFGSIFTEEDYIRSKALLWKDYVISQTIAMSSDYMVGIQDTGKLIGKELNQKNHSYTEFSSWNEVEYVAMTEDTILGLCSNGTVLAEGNSKLKNKVSKWKNIVQIYTVGDIAFGLRADGKIIHTSSRNHKVLKDITKWENVVNFDIAEHVYSRYDSDDTFYDYYAAAVCLDGSVLYSDSEDSYTKEISSWQDITMISLSYGEWIGMHIVGLKKDHTVVAAGTNHNNCCNIGSWTNIIQLHTMATYTFGLHKNGTILVAGSDAFSRKDASNIKEGAYLPKIGNLLVVDKTGNLQCENGKTLAMQDWKNIKVPNNPFQ